MRVSLVNLAMPKGRCLGTMTNHVAFGNEQKITPLQEFNLDSIGLVNSANRGDWNKIKPEKGRLGLDAIEDGFIKVKRTQHAYEINYNTSKYGELPQEVITALQSNKPLDISFARSTDYTYPWACVQVKTEEGAKAVASIFTKFRAVARELIEYSRGVLGKL